MVASTVIDTDIGDDVDDAFALALATRLPQLALRGVVTVAGPVERRAALARDLLAAAAVPGVQVVAGNSSRLDGRPGSQRFTPVGLQRVPNPGSTDARFVDQPYSTLIPQPAALTIIALGPLTNLAVALGRDPTLAQRARVVAMAGKLGAPYPDWNLRCDPRAARRVLSSGVPLRMVGMHLTMRARLRPPQLRRLFERDDPLARFLGRCVIVWRTRVRRVPILHDALAVAAAADPSLIEWQERRVLVGPYGFSLALRGGAPNALVGVDVDMGRFWRLLEDALL